MKFLSVISLSLFISVKSSTARAQDGTLQENAKTNVNSSTATEDGTFHENAKRNGNAGLNVVLRNDAKQESQLTRFRRSQSHSDDTRACYRHYFVERTPPTGFINDPSYMYICQGDCVIGPNKGCFSTLYDLNYKIPIYAAYVLWQSDWRKKDPSNYNYWQKETNDPGLDQNIKDILKEIDSMYSNTGFLPCIHKGHLVPAETYSFTPANRQSTFVYTNAVPQYETFNSGEWSAYEKNIRENHWKNCAEGKGDLYLLTGISDHRIGKNMNGKIYDNGIPADTPMRMPVQPNVVIPNSMWTAGCCVHDEIVLDSFAVIGNNDPIKDDIYMSEVTVKELEGIIGKGVHGGIQLFPGNNDCNNIYSYDKTQRAL